MKQILIKPFRLVGTILGGILVLAGTVELWLTVWDAWFDPFARPALGTSLLVAGVLYLSGTSLIRFSWRAK